MEGVYISNLHKSVTTLQGRNGALVNWWQMPRALGTRFGGGRGDGSGHDRMMMMNNIIINNKKK